MKKRHILLIAPLVLLMLWVVSMLIPIGLTSLFGNDFSDFETINYPTFFESMNYRVMFYSSDKAIVYFWTDGYGEQILFKRDESDNWKFQKCLAQWSTQSGNADDYFIWPYFTNFVW